MTDSYETKTDAELVAGAAFHPAPSFNVVGSPESVEATRHLTMQGPHDTAERFHDRGISLIRVLVVLTVVLVALTVTLAYFAAHH